MPAQPLIVGAGPVGLAAALFLARQGTIPRIFDKLEHPSPWSKALAVNPRTLTILEPTGVTARMLEIGRPMRAVNFNQGTRTLAVISLGAIHPTYPFLVALSQATTERLLAEALQAAGGTIERPVELDTCRIAADHVEARLDTGEAVQAPWILGADGAHSAVRHALGIDFQGDALQGRWHLADVPLTTKLANDNGHAFLLDDGAFLFLIPVVDDSHRPLWRVISNRDDPLARLVNAEPAGPPVWESSFPVPHRIAANLGSANAFLAGDAAHVHSPIGARGMNLGIEDAYVFSELHRTNRLGEYHALRYPVDRRVVRLVRLISRTIAADSPVARLARRVVFPLVVRTPIARRRIVRTATGLDHDLPEFS